MYLFVDRMQGASRTRIEYISTGARCRRLEDRDHATTCRGMPFRISPCLVTSQAMAGTRRSQPTKASSTSITKLPVDDNIKLLLSGILRNGYGLPWSFGLRAQGIPRE